MPQTAQKYFHPKTLEKTPEAIPWSLTQETNTLLTESGKSYAVALTHVHLNI